MKYIFHHISYIYSMPYVGYIAAYIPFRFGLNPNLDHAGDASSRKTKRHPGPGQTGSDWREPGITSRPTSAPLHPGLQIPNPNKMFGGCGFSPIHVVWCQHQSLVGRGVGGRGGGSLGDGVGGGEAHPLRGWENMLNITILVSSGGPRSNVDPIYTSPH